MSLASQIVLLAQRAAAEAKSIRTLVNGNLANLSALTTTATGNLVAALNEVNAKTVPGVGTATMSGSCTVNSFSCTRIAKSVNGQAYINLGANGAPANSLVFTLNANYRPGTNMTIRCPIYTNGTAGFIGDYADVEFGSDGTATIRYTNRTIPAGSIVCLSFSFATA